MSEWFVRHIPRCRWTYCFFQALSSSGYIAIWKAMENYQTPARTTIRCVCPISSLTFAFIVSYFVTNGVRGMKNAFINYCFTSSWSQLMRVRLSTSLLLLVMNRTLNTKCRGVASRWKRTLRDTKWWIEGFRWLVGRKKNYDISLFDEKHFARNKSTILIRALIEYKRSQFLLKQQAIRITTCLENNHVSSINNHRIVLQWPKIGWKT